MNKAKANFWKDGGSNAAGTADAVDAPFDDEGASDVKRHLETLGFVEGSQVHVVTAGGGNIIVMVKGARFGLDVKVARNVMVA